MPNNNNEKLEAKILNEIRISEKNISLEELSALFPANRNKIKQIINKLTFTGIIEKIENNNKISYIIRSTKKPLNKKTLVIKKIKRAINRLKKMINSFFPHIISFAAVMTGLIILNIISSPGYLWFLWVLGSWGIGLFIHFISVITAVRHKNKLQNLSYNITLEQFKIFQKILINEQSLYSHSASYIIVNTFLFCIYWFIAHTTHPWILYPVIGWGIGMAIHLITYFQLSNQLKKRLKMTGFNFESIKNKKTNQNNLNTKVNIVSEINNDYRNIINEAVEIKKSIIDNINSNEKIKNKIDEGIEEIIDKHINKIKDLTLRDKKITAAISSISIDEINNQVMKLQKKLNTTNNNDLKKEYNKTIDKYKKQIKTYDDLNEKKEIYYLRISNSLINLKQLNLDLFNMKELIQDEDSYSFNILEEQIDDLSNHVKNLKDSYSVLDRELE